MKANCNNAPTHTFHSDSGVAVRSGANIVQVSNQNGASVSCDLLLEVCSFTLDGWLHGRKIKDSVRLPMVVPIFVNFTLLRNKNCHINMFLSTQARPLVC